LGIGSIGVASRRAETLIGAVVLHAAGQIVRRRADQRAHGRNARGGTGVDAVAVADVIVAHVFGETIAVATDLTDARDDAELRVVLGRATPTADIVRLGREAVLRFFAAARLNAEFAFVGRVRGF